MDDVDTQAADWLLRLSEGPLNAEQLRQFEDWRQEPRHAQAFERLQGFIGQLHALRPQQAAAGAALAAGRVRRTRLLPGGLGLLLLVAGLGLLLHVNPPRVLFADLRTAPAEWHSQRLADDSLLELSGNSAVDLHFDEHERRVELLRGEILVEVAKDSRRPFVVETEHGRIRALGTRFLVRREGQATLLSMLESRVEASASQAPARLEVAGGARARISSERVELLGAIDPDSLQRSWRNHQLVVQDQPLADVLEQLQRQRGGLIHFQRQALADLRISAVLPLDDSERALQLIAEALPVRVRQFSPWLVVVERQAAGTAE